MENKPICYVPEREYPDVFSGVPSFLGLPVIKTENDFDAADIVVMGVPWEGVCTYGGFSQTELSTKIIRQASKRYGGYLPDYDLDVFDYFTGGDIGDIPVQNGNYEFTYDSIRKNMKKLMDGKKIPIVFGGDHSISYPLISEFAKAHNGNIGIIHFDAHMDNMESYGDEEYARCSPFHRLYEDENINPQKMVHFGIRGPRNNPDGLKAAKKFGAHVITGMEIKLKGIEDSIKKAIDIAFDGTEAVYVTVCSDILDVANNPAGPPDPCGLTSWELAYALNQCGKAGASAFDFVELYPPNDPHNVSAHVAVWMTVYYLVGLTQYRFNK